MRGLKKSLPMDNEERAARLSGMMGLARRAGKLTFGFDAVLEDIAAGKAKAAFLSSDASARTAGGVKEKCAARGVRLAALPLSKTALGRAIGRDDVAVVAITDRSFADRLIELAKTPELYSGGN